jgi:hypothetical protein
LASGSKFQASFFIQSLLGEGGNLISPNFYIKYIYRNMINWRRIHKDFNREWLLGKTYKHKWEEEGLTYQDAQEWIEAGFKPQDYRLIKQWKDNNFLSREVGDWIRTGLDKGDCRFAIYLRNRGYRPNLSMEQVEQLNGEFHIWEENQKLIQYQHQPPK